MCGIYCTNLNFSKKNVLDKLSSIEFRGPDNTGYKKINNIILGHLRLSILDLDPRSDQPMRDEDILISFNGEIYNYLDIKKELSKKGIAFETESDTEVLLKAYKVWGVQMLQKINGMFAFCIYDLKKNLLFSARDRMGVKPFYYYWKEGMFEICSQLRPLISQQSQLNHNSVGMYLDCGYVPSPYSIIEDVHKLPPGHYMIIDLDNNQYEVKKYWDIQKVSLSKRNYQQSKEELRNLLEDAVKIRLNSDVPIGSFLSGGIDSALVSSVASKISKSKINTFSIGFKNKKYDESHISEKYAKILDTNHQTIICEVEDLLSLIPKHREVFDEPFADSSALPSLLLNQVTKQYVTVALSGDGGDESFLGYNYLGLLNSHKAFFLLPSYIKRGIKYLGKILNIHKLNNIPDELLATNGARDYIIDYFTGIDSIKLKGDKNWISKYYGRYLSLSRNILQKAADFNLKLWLENDSNVKVDRASMAYSVEVRSPFLDYRIVELARTFPIKYRFRRKVQKRILRDLLKEYIPEEVFNQPKKGFGIPLGDWIRNNLREEFETKLNDAFLNTVPNLDITKFKKQFNDHMEGKRDHKTNIWKMYVLRQWYEEFGFYTS